MLLPIQVKSARAEIRASSEYPSLQPLGPRGGGGGGQPQPSCTDNCQSTRSYCENQCNNGPIANRFECNQACWNNYGYCISIC
jgi:hypothetical protein